MYWNVIQILKEINKLQYLTTIILKNHVAYSFYLCFKHGQVGSVGHEFGPAQADLIFFTQQT